MRLICFDLDGTLVDSRADIAAAVNEALGSYGVPAVGPDRMASLVGDGLARTVERAAQGYEVPVGEAVKKTVEYYLEHPVVYSRLYDGVFQGLELLKGKGLGLALLTNKLQAIAEKILNEFKILGFFDYVAGAGAGYPLKPDPAALNHMLEISNSDRKASLMVGDGYTDLEAGRRAGIGTCLCSYGYGDPRDFVPDLRVSSFQEFIGIFS